MNTPEQISKSIDLGDGTQCCNRAVGGICYTHGEIADRIRQERKRVNKMVSNAARLAELAWGQIVMWNLAGKIQGDLRREEFQKPLEAKFKEALGE
jgi:hypothetical protein